MRSERTIIKTPDCHCCSTWTEERDALAHWMDLRAGSGSDGYTGTSFWRCLGSHARIRPTSVIKSGSVLVAQGPHLFLPPTSKKGRVDTLVPLHAFQLGLLQLTIRPEGSDEQLLLLLSASPSPLHNRTHRLRFISLRIALSSCGANRPSHQCSDFISFGSDAGRLRAPASQLCCAAMVPWCHGAISELQSFESDELGWRGAC